MNLKKWQKITRWQENVLFKYLSAGKGGNDTKFATFYKNQPIMLNLAHLFIHAFCSKSSKYGLKLITHILAILTD